jgi:membrane fusion protein (multidrug efflux system)
LDSISLMSFATSFDPARKPCSARVFFAAVACAVLLLAGCGKGNDDAAKKKGAAAAPPPAIPVAVKQVQPQRIPITLETVGQAEGSREVEVRARVSGIVERRLYTEGAPVKAGAVLFLIDRAPYDIAVAQAKAALSQERARQELAAREAERLRALVQSKAISGREYDEAQSTLKQSSAAIEGAQAKLEEAQLNLSYTSVRAPISGITGRALRSEGSLVTVNTDTALLTTLTQVDPVWVRFSLATSDFDRIRGGERTAQVKIAREDGSNEAANGRLNFAGSTVDPKLGTVQLRAEFPNRTLAWLPGQFVKVQILAGEQEAFLVPQAAVVQSEQARSVWVVGPDGKVAPRQVQTAGWYQNDWVVTAGLKPGDAVVVDNIIKMRPGVAVQARTGAPQQAEAAPAPAGAPAQKGATSASAR